MSLLDDDSLNKSVLEADAIKGFSIELYLFWKLTRAPSPRRKINVTFSNQHLKAYIADDKIYIKITGISQRHIETLCNIFDISNPPKAPGKSKSDEPAETNNNDEKKKKTRRKSSRKSKVTPMWGPKSNARGTKRPGARSVIRLIHWVWYLLYE